VYVSDFNKDGKLDVLVWDYNSIAGTQGHNIYEFLGNGDGTFAPAKLVLPNIGFFTVSDVNHDGLPDIVAFDENLNSDYTDLYPVSVSIYLGQPDGSFVKSEGYQPYTGLSFDFTAANESAPQSEGPMVADFNGDGNPDIAVFQVSKLNPNGISYGEILIGNGDGTFTPTYSGIKADTWFPPQVAADVNGDGCADLIELNGYPSSYHVILAAPGPALQLSFASYPIVGPAGTLQLMLSAPSSGSTTIQLSASDPNITIPASVKISSGSLIASVPFTIGASFNPLQVFTIQGQLAGQTATAKSSGAVRYSPTRRV
jgi:hypothetical protein